MRVCSLVACIFSVGALASCSNPTTIPPHAVRLGDADAHLVGDRLEPLPLRVPIRGVMAGIVDFSSYGVFKLALSDAPLVENDWTAAGYAAINLISASSLITLSGTGPDDAARVADPRWRAYAAELQASSIAAGIAVREKDRDKLLAAANRIAAACAACHSVFRSDPSQPDARQFAGY